LGSYSYKAINDGIGGIVHQLPKDFTLSMWKPEVLNNKTQKLIRGMYPNNNRRLLRGWLLPYMKLEKQIGVHVFD
jgi:hypothetical protein